MSEWFYKKISQLAGYFAVAVLFGLIVFAANIEIKDIDLWFHLGVGKHILQTSLIPSDPCSREWKSGLRLESRPRMGAEVGRVMIGPRNLSALDTNARMMVPG